MRRFLCLWFPRWPTDRWRRQGNAQPGPLVLTAAGQGGIRLTAVDQAASRLGLAVGMPLADARALVPGLNVADAALEVDARALAAIAGWCTRYSPWCAVDGADGIRLDITGCDHLFGGEAAMLADMERRLRAFGCAVRGAVADTPAAAWGWARYRRNKQPPVLGVGQIDPLMALPVAALRLDADSLETLAVLGLATIGTVVALPRGPLAQRLGAAVLLRLDRMFGRVSEPISPRPATEPWISRMIFAEAIGRREDIDAATDHLVTRLCHDMGLKGQGARRLVLVFYRVDGGVQHIAIGTSSPSHMPTHILRLFAERLETVEPGFGIEAMVLEATETEPLLPAQTTLSETGEIDAVALAGLIDRLQNRLGPNRVVQLVPVESHVPERAEMYRPASARVSPAKVASPLEGEVGDAQPRREGGTVGAFTVMSKGRRHHPPPGPAGRPPPQGGRRFKSVRGAATASFLKSARPLTLLPVPEPIEATAPIPDDPPLFFRWRRNLHRVAFADGPERIGPEWWLPGQGKARDYYRVEDADGRRFWLYREGLYGAVLPPRWFLHGFFPMTPYAELQVTSHFSFLRGASSPGELILQAYGLGLSAIAIADRNTLAGVVRAYQAAQETGVRLLVGTRLDFTDMPSLLCFPEDRAAYGRLSQMLTDGKMRSEKGQCTLTLDDLFAYGDGQRLVALPVEQPDAAFADHLRRLNRRFGRSLYLAAHHLYRGDDAKRLARLGDLADVVGVPLVATNDVHAHVASRRPLQDVLTCIREGTTVATAGFLLNANAERHLKSPQEMARLFRRRPDAVARTMEIVEACNFSLGELKYEYPAEPVPEGQTPQGELVRQVRLHAPDRYPNGVPAKVQALLRKELALIKKLQYARYFLTVYDIVKYAREKEILCQGRGSAANSAVCYVLGITAVDPETTQLLIERFLSEERKEPPDIDVDFEHERREEVMQYIYKKYGRDRAGIVATLVTYRPKSAIRDVGKALGLSEDVVGILSKTMWGWGREGIQEQYIREAGLDPAEPNLRNALILAGQLMGFPRHLSQHTGGFVITRGKLSEVVPIENASMDERTVIEWDKDDLDILGMLKIDVLALGMLTCLRKGFDLLKTHYGVERRLYDNEADPAVYDMLCKADSVGVFQVESRAQMTMLPRLRPRCLYDLVIEVAIVRPGPIQGDMVHPYLERRHSPEKVTFPKPELEEVLKRTCGVPLFQEQAMEIAMVAARFTPDEANRLRKAMATFRRNGTMHALKDRFIEGMVANDYERDFAERCFRQIEGFGDYGFPESHAASFALLVYASSWIKCHYPAVFACAILNSQPMGFYRPAQLVRDAKDHGVEVRPVDVMHSDWDCTLEVVSPRNFALRLGFCQLKGFNEEDANALVEARAKGDFATMRSVWLRAGLGERALATLAKGDAWGSVALNRRGALWAAKGLGAKPLPLFAAADGAERAEPAVTLPAMSMGQEVTEDYRHLSLSLKCHPVSLLRDGLAGEGIVPAERLKHLRDGAKARVAGIVLIRQQPGTASGVIFMTLEDETGVANIVVWPTMFKQFRREVLGSQLLAVTGIVQRDASGHVIHVIANHMTDLSERLHALGDPARPYADMLSRADEEKTGGFNRPVNSRGSVIPRSRDFR